ncbi:SDR family oxidoreductase [Aestuariirhabdus sp. Z084]|uniref:SDR family oxidoreductase n=1 Tax=Aestuariirhabdus haliotis TaxID=2918751 RepID=UPI00201B3570|nr:SDR family oxidoreductase [Aestuariirhabdus haliotis]MCL6416221.1 SDR family oxidoreductase [Aestuariirhabdus haliotis]MCL6420319.1 SDR family oxidoreductase [Aestuariirhabdus haliotis]
MASVMITGCNRGLGLEMTRQYLADGWMVYASCRDVSNCTELDDLAATSPNLKVFELDISSNESIDRLVAQLGDQPLDLLVQNAGVYGPTPGNLQQVSADTWMETLRINTVAPLMLVQRLLVNLDRGENPAIAILSSKMGSISDNGSGGSYVYRSTKAALNAVGKSLSLDLKAQGIRVLMMHPGWVRTDMGGPNGLIDVHTSVTGMRHVIAASTLKESGGFFNYDGSPIPW